MEVHSNKIVPIDLKNAPMFFHYVFSYPGEEGLVDVTL